MGAAEVLDLQELQAQLDQAVELLVQSEPQDLRELLDRLGQRGPRGRKAIRELRALLAYREIREQV